MCCDERPGLYRLRHASPTIASPLFPPPLQLLAAVNATRAASMVRNDWYRLSRSLEVSVRRSSKPGLLTSYPARFCSFRFALSRAFCARVPQCALFYTLPLFRHGPIVSGTEENSSLYFARRRARRVVAAYAAHPSVDQYPAMPRVPSSDVSPQVLRIPNATSKEAFTGVRTRVSEKYDFRSFFIIGDRERLFRRIDGR